MGMPIIIIIIIFKARPSTRGRTVPQEPFTPEFANGTGPPATAEQRKAGKPQESRKLRIFTWRVIKHHGDAASPFSNGNVNMRHHIRTKIQLKTSL